MSTFSRQLDERQWALWSLALPVIGFLLLLGLAQPVAAHTEGKMQLSAAEAGPYKLTVWTSPDPAGVGELHVAVALVLAEDASPVLDAQINVQLTPVDGGSGQSRPATTEDSENKFLYEAVFEPTEPGLYQIDILVNGADGSMGEAGFELDITGGSSFNSLYLIPIALGLVAVILLIVAFRGRGTAANQSTPD